MLLTATMTEACSQKIHRHHCHCQASVAGNLSPNLLFLSYTLSVKCTQRRFIHLLAMASQILRPGSVSKAVSKLTLAIPSAICRVKSVTSVPSCYLLRPPMRCTAKRRDTTTADVDADIRANRAAERRNLTEQTCRDPI